jgi:hypothetical protein
MSNPTCEQCESTPGTTYAFHYGRRAARTGTGQAGTEPVFRATVHGRSPATGEYEVGGLEAVILCDGCLTRARARRAGRLVLREWVRTPLIAFAYLVWAVVVGAWAWQGNWTQAAIWLGGGLVLSAAVYAVTYLILESEDFAQHTAVDLHEEKLREQGWDLFWTEKEFGHLTPH